MADLSLLHEGDSIGGSISEYVRVGPKDTLITTKAVVHLVPGEPLDNAQMRMETVLIRNLDHLVATYLESKENH